MKHHFADTLDRSGDYWTTIPNRERYSYAADVEISDKNAVRILTISKQHRNWEQVFSCPNIEELTLHDPSKDQVQATRELKQLKRLRVTFLRTNDIEFIGSLNNLEELVLEYVSGFSDLTPLQKLTRLKSLHFENIRRVSNFDGLKGLTGLKYLHIDGTLDWNQPIENFSFLEGLPGLEVLSLGFVINKSDFPAFLPILKLGKLRRIKVGLATFHTKEYAFLETAFPGDTCCSLGGTPWTPCYQINSEHIEFIGKSAGNVKLNSPNANEKINAFKKKYEEYKTESERILKSTS